MNDKPTYLHEAGQDRERIAIERWLVVHCEEVMTFLGLPDGWWCGLGLLRRDIFGDSQSGDVDLIAGPIELTISDEEMNDRLNAERASRPGVDDSLIRSLVTMDVCRAGLIEWPPRLDYIAAMEAKASYFDHRIWKSTHVGKATRIRGQLETLTARQVNRVAFLHLGSINPTSNAATSWTDADRLLDRAVPSWEHAFDPDAMPGVGYMRAITAAAPDALEDFGGVRETMIEHEPALLAVRGPQPWHKYLHDRLSAVAKPQYSRTFIFPCTDCGSWRCAGITDLSRAPCACRAREGT